MFTGFSPYSFGPRLPSGTSWQQKADVHIKTARKQRAVESNQGLFSYLQETTHSELTILARSHLLKFPVLLKSVPPVEAGI